MKDGGLRCPIGCATWPNDHRFRTCPTCGEATSYFSNIRPDYDLEEAMSVKNHIMFEKFYEKWDAEQPPGRLVMTAKEALRYTERSEQADSAL